MASIVSIVGKAKSGKTTLLEKLVNILSKRGYHVATAKHVFHELAFDKPDKDSGRHISAGSQATIIGSSDKIVLIQPVKEGAKLADILRIFGEDYDIILVEGFKQSDTPKIEVHRKDTGPPLQSLSNLIAIATDEELSTPTRQLMLSDAECIADFIETNIIKPEKQHLSVYINKNRIRLSSFRIKLISNTILALVSSIKSTKKIRSLDIFLRTDRDTRKS